MKQSNDTCECIICMGSISQAVATICGHLFCWGCLYLWMNNTSDQFKCPACQTKLNKTQIISIYGLRETSIVNPEIPERPKLLSNILDPSNRYNSFREFILRISLLINENYQPLLNVGNVFPNIFKLISSLLIGLSIHNFLFDFDKQKNKISFVWNLF